MDALAVAVGSSHAQVERTTQLDLDLVAQLAAAVHVPLVLHGSSGVPDAELVRAIRAGLTKINIGTHLNVTLTRSVRDTLADQPRLVDPRKYPGPARPWPTRARLLTQAAPSRPVCVCRPLGLDPELEHWPDPSGEEPGGSRPW